MSDWHTYAVEWEPGEIRFYVDGVQTCTYDHWWSCSKLQAAQVWSRPDGPADLNPWPAPFDQPFYLVMNVAVGGNFPGAPNDATLSPPSWWWTTCACTRRWAAMARPKPIGSGQFPWQSRPQPGRPP